MGQRLDNATALYVEAIRDGNYIDAINTYSGERYTQHSTPVKDGKQGFIEFFGDFVERNPDREIEIVRSFEDGQYVFLHVVQLLNGGQFCYVTADIFDTDREGKLIEHWDIIDELKGQTASGHTQVDGPTEPSDLDKTGENKALVDRFVREVLMTGARDLVSEFISADNHVEHNPDLGTGPAMSYEELHLVVGSGSFVATLAKANLDGRDMAVIDLFRVSDGLIVEHWDVVEEILPADQWVNSGKF